MGKKAIILAVVCVQIISQVTGDTGSVIHSAAVQDNESAESAPRLYRNVPVGVYASAVPYASYTFQLPQFTAAPRSAASQVIPVKQKLVNQNVHTYLMDSYGNRFAETPQLASYKAAFPQQYVSLQPNLPEHLAQPLVAASPNFQFKQSAPQVFFGAPYRVPALQSSPSTTLHNFPSFGQHLVYAEKVQSLAPTSNGHAFGVTSAQQQPSNNKAVFTNTQSPEQYNNYKNGSTFQRKQQVPQIIVGKPKQQNIQETSHVPYSETHFQRQQETPRSVLGEGKFQHIKEKPQPVNGEVKFQRLQDVSHHPQEASHDLKSQRNQKIPYVLKDEAKFQKVQESPQVSHKEHSYVHVQDVPNYQQEKSRDIHNHKAQLQSAPAKQTTITYTNDNNGKTTVVKVKTKPLPLLDLTLLEPLKFDNPLVPQVQHFLPRINQATYTKLPEVPNGIKNYQKEFVVQKTMSYDSSTVSEKPQKESPKKKQKKPIPSNKHTKKNDAPKKITVTYETLDDAPEIVYEISNSPGHKETIKQKTISYNKETQSEPVHYSYGSESEKDPVNYSYSRTTNEPVQIKKVHYHSNGQVPSHLIYNFKPEEQNKEEQVHNNGPLNESESPNDYSKESESSGPEYHDYHTEHYEEQPKSSTEHHGPPHQKQDQYHRPENQHQSLHPSNHHSAPSQHTQQHYNFEPITQEYEEDIRLLANAQIKVDPSQHVNNEKPVSQHDEQSHPPQRHQSSVPHQHSYSSPRPQPHFYYSTPKSESQAPATHIHEKSKRIIIHEEAPDERHTHSEQTKEEVANREENSEEDFEKAYKNAAFGFPAYSKEVFDAAEKDIFDPESYGVPPDHVEYNIEHTPFQQYQEEGDDFPKETRVSYKNARDKMKEDYYVDYSISKPESLLDRYQNKLGYYKLYKQQKPEYYVFNENDDDKKKQKQRFAKYSVVPSFDFPSAKQEKAKSYYGHHKPKEQLYEYDYSKETPRDSSAFASLPYQRYKSNTHFVEPQFQYGFEPISIPKLLDSELAAMASNNSPESEKPLRKKLYKENWYIKKTSTSAGAPAS